MRNLYELYKRGIISEDELNKVTQKEELEKINRLNKVYKNYNTKDVNTNRFSKKEKQKAEVVDLDNVLDSVLEAEFKEFKNGLMKKSKEEIFDSAYEITAKQEIKDELKYMKLHRAEIEMLILQDDILNEFYHDWLDDDTPLGESMQPCIEESIAVLTKYIGKRFNLSREKDER